MVTPQRPTHHELIATELRVSARQVLATIELLDDGATVPFVARYRKEATGSLDEVAITLIRDRIGQLRELDKRREAIVKSLTERELLTPELAGSIDAAGSMAELEDIYLPYRPKRRTRASVARERGLEPLAELLLEQESENPGKEAEAFVDPEKEIPDVDAALSGARDIIAEWICEDADIRARLRELFRRKAIVGSLVASGKETEGTKYSDYFEREEPLPRMPSHRMLALRRGEKEGILALSIRPPEADALAIIETAYLTVRGASSEQVALAVADSYKRLLAPSMENEIRAESKEKADTEAIRVFCRNLTELLMAPPLGAKSLLAIDPGFRTGCKTVVLDPQGLLLEHGVIYPHASENELRQAEVEIKALCEKYRVRVIAVGNGTAGRETESFLRSIQLPGNPDIEMVNESGASVYSASDIAREEFPDQDVTVRGAVSIGRRLMDPLAELVKIEPKAIGVGQYQHDVDQTALKSALDDTVLSCVNRVGVDVNTASRPLLTYVAGVGPALAQAIVKYRETNGPFRSRKEILKVPRLGPRVFEQAAGFLRIPNAANPLDRSAVHPESYHVVEQMARDLDCTVEQLMSDPGRRQRIDPSKYVTEKTGLPTLRDILDELERPGRDPRPPYTPFHFDDQVKTLEDLKVGLELPGIVTNVTAFGAFVDIGVHHDGLVHKSRMGRRYVNDPSEILRVHQRVKVRVLEVDIARQRVSLELLIVPSVPG